MIYLIFHPSPTPSVRSLRGRDRGAGSDKKAPQEVVRTDGRQISLKFGFSRKTISEAVKILSSVMMIDDSELNEMTTEELKQAVKAMTAAALYLTNDNY